MLNEWKLSDYVSINSLERDGWMWCKANKREYKLDYMIFFYSNYTLLQHP